MCASCVEESKTKKHLKGRENVQIINTKINVDKRKMKGPEVFAGLVHSHNIENIL